MKRFNHLLSVTVIVFVTSLSMQAFAQDEKLTKKKAAEKAAGTHSPRGGEDPLANLTSEERKLLHETMRKAWNDPALVQAREDVSKAADAYQKAMREAMHRANPEAGEVIAKVQKSSEGRFRKMLPGQGRGSGGHLEEMTRAPAFLNDLTDEERERYAKAREKAKSSPEVQAVFKEMENLRKRDESLRKERIEAFGKVRKSIYVTMLKNDPSLKDIIPADFKGGGGGPSKGGKGGKGKGKGPGPSGEGGKKRPPSE